MTREEIRDLSRKRLGETTSAFWSDAELNSWINEAGADIAFKTNSVKANGYMTTIEDQAEYVLSTDFPNLISIDQVYMYQDASTLQKLHPTSRTELDIQQPGWKSVDSGTPIKYYWSKDEDLFGLFVKPNEANSGTEYIKIYYSRTYADLAADSNSPNLPDFLHMGMVFYVAAIGFGSRGYGDKENDMMAKYLGRIQEFMVGKNVRETEDEDIVMKNYKNII